MSSADGDELDYRQTGKSRFGDYIPTKFVRGLCKEHGLSFRTFVTETYGNTKDELFFGDNINPNGRFIKVDEIFDWLGY